MKTTRIFHLKVVYFLVVKLSIYLNRHVFVMCRPLACAACGDSSLVIKVGFKGVKIIKACFHDVIIISIIIIIIIIIII